MKEKKTSRTYRVIKWLVKLFYPKTQVVGAENLPDAPAVIVGNHSQLHGPIVCELYLPCRRYTWCAGQMMNRKEVPAYAYRDFWSRKPQYIRWFYKLLSHLIAPLSECVFTNAETIAVYHDTRILSTFKKTVAALADGASVVIFPESDVPHDHILNQFHDKFIDVARLYYKKTGKALQFVPMYIAPKLKSVYLGKPVSFSPEAPIEEQRQTISRYLMAQISAIATALPEHVVVPFQNVPKKEYKTNRPAEIV